MNVEICDRFNECVIIKSNVERVMETRYAFKLKYHDGNYSREFLKGDFDYCIKENR